MTAGRAYDPEDLSVPQDTPHAGGARKGSVCGPEAGVAPPGWSWTCRERWPDSAAGFWRWRPGVRAGLPADDGSRELPAGQRDDTTGKGKDQDAERLPRDVATQHEPRAQAEPSASDAPNPHEPALGETKRHALIRLYEHCGQTGDPRYGNHAKTTELAGEIAARIGYHAGTARRELAKYLASRSARVPRRAGPACRWKPACGAAPGPGAPLAHPAVPAAGRRVREPPRTRGALVTPAGGRYRPPLQAVAAVVGAGAPARDRLRGPARAGALRQARDRQQPGVRPSRLGVVGGGC